MGGPSRLVTGIWSQVGAVLFGTAPLNLWYLMLTPGNWCPRIGVRLKSVNLPLIQCIRQKQIKMKEAEPTSVLWGGGAQSSICCGVGLRFRWLLKFSLFFSYQSSLSLDFLLVVLHLYLGNFTRWPGQISLSPTCIPGQIHVCGQGKCVCVSPCMKMIISVLITP